MKNGTEVILMGVDLINHHNHLIVYKPGNNGITILDLTLDDLNLPDRKIDFFFVKGSESEVHLTKKNYEKLCFQLFNLTNANRWKIGKEIYNHMSKFGDLELSCADEKITISKFLLSTNSPYFCSYFTSQSFNHVYRFYGSSYLIKDYMHWCLTSKNLDETKLLDVPSEFLEFAVYIQDNEYLYHLYRELETEIENVGEYIAEILNIKSGDYFLGYIYEKMDESIVEKRKLCMLYGKIEQNDYLAIVHNSPYLFDRVMEQWTEEENSSQFISNQNSNQNSSDQFISSSQEINVPREYMELYRRHKMNMDFIPIEEDILSLLSFAHFIQDYLFMLWLVSCFFTQSKNNIVKREINLFLDSLTINI